MKAFINFWIQRRFSYYDFPNKSNRDFEEITLNKFKEQFFKKQIIPSIRLKSSNTILSSRYKINKFNSHWPKFPKSIELPQHSHQHLQATSHDPHTFRITKSLKRNPKFAKFPTMGHILYRKWSFRVLQLNERAISPRENEKQYSQEGAKRDCRLESKSPFNCWKWKVKMTRKLGEITGNLPRAFPARTSSRAGVLPLRSRLRDS